MSKFTWRIENFSRLDAEDLYSLTFVVNENKWRLRLYPKGSHTNQHLSLYFNVGYPCTLPRKFIVSLVNQFDSNKTIKRECEYTFKSGKSSLGWPSFVELGKFHDKSEGYLVEDACLIEAEVDVSPDSKDIDSDSSIAKDPIECVYIEALSFLESNYSPASNTPTCEMHWFIKRNAAFAIKILDKLVPYHLDKSADLKHETTVMGSLSKRTDHLYLFSDPQAKEIVKLKANFPQRMLESRDSVHIKKDTSGHPWSTFEKTKDLLQESVKIEEGIKIELEELIKKEKELEARLEAMESDSLQLKMEREEIPKQMKIVCSLAKEKARKIEDKKLEVGCANQQLEQRLKSKWAAMRHLFA
ncbi:unnamed protein product [Cuscuta campestris]|uniref:MATH domain-containing protein n=1 Tax=Cuscuta campestris TaxID=132261 RepID=A0A484N2G7_9ASTE|nr:unnamed protein product [Cuscuta campestris]